MLNVQTASSIINLITFLIAYGCSVTLAGCFTAWIVYKLGDETPVESGFLTLNPLAHIDFLGTLFLILYKFGWSRFIPINPFNIQGPLRFIKVLVAFLAEAVAFFVLALLSLLALIAFFGERIMLYEFPQGFPDSSSYMVSIGLILISMLIVNMVLAVVVFFVNMCGMAIMLITEEKPEYHVYGTLIMVIVPITLYYLFGNIMVIFVAGLIQKSGYFLAALLHLF